MPERAKFPPGRSLTATPVHHVREGRQRAREVRLGWAEGPSWNTAIALLPVVLFLLLSFPVSSAADVELPVHGNYCGHGGSGPVTSTLDEACKQHDDCYVKRGRQDCKCDKALVARAESIAGSTNSEQERAAAVAIVGFFKFLPCSPVRKDENILLRAVGALLSPLGGLFK